MKAETGVLLSRFSNVSINFTLLYSHAEPVKTLLLS